MSNVIKSPLPELKLPDQSMASFLLDKLLEYKNKTFFIDCDKDAKWSGEQFNKAILNVSQAMINKFGVESNDVVLFYVPNSDISAITILSVFTVGAIYSAIPSTSTYREVIDWINIIKPKYLICDEDTFENSNKILSEGSTIKRLLIIAKDTNGHQKENSPIINDYLHGDLNNNVEYPTKLPVDRALDDVAAILMTSGSTGASKAIIRTNRNIMATAFSIDHPELTGYKPGHVVLTTSFCHGVAIRILMNVLITGATLASMKKIYEPSRHTYLTYIEKYKINSIFVSPTGIYFIIKGENFKKYHLTSLFDVTCGGVGVPNTIFDSVEQNLNIKYFRQIYGLSEVGRVAQVYISKLADHNRKTVGNLVRGLQLKIISKKTGESLGVNQTGEICIKGDQVTPGYMGEDNSKFLTEDGFFRTGDEGFYDEDGQIYIVGRYKDVINVSGHAVSASELESILYSHFAVQEVAIIGVYDKALVEVPKAFILLKNQSKGKVSEDELVKHVNEKVEFIKQLRGGVVFVEEFPRTRNGKIKKSALKMLN